MATKIHRGSCHCKRIQYEVSVDLDLGTYKCNCTYCFKVRNWGGLVKPEAFRWLSSGADLGSYQIRAGSQNFYYFCKHCGVRVGTQGFVEEIGGAYFTFSISTLDDVQQEEFAALPVQYTDGLNNDWPHSPLVTKHL